MKFEFLKRKNSAFFLKVLMRLVSLWLGYIFYIEILTHTTQFKPEITSRFIYQALFGTFALNIWIWLTTTQWGVKYPWILLFMSLPSLFFGTLLSYEYYHILLAFLILGITSIHYLNLIKERNVRKNLLLGAEKQSMR